DLENLGNVKNFWDFDNLITAKLHGFKDAKDYYEKSSSFHYLSKITKKTLILHARNDPFLYLDAIPDQNELPGNIQLELQQSGGHVGFIAGALPWRPQYWLEERVPSYIHASFLAES
ncbi:MAG TPA: hydrolase, partial [Chlamydiales bacterium]|nr:hydrolase [Chlamydiales bacterium]